MQATKQAHSNFLVSPRSLAHGRNVAQRCERPFAPLTAVEKKSSKETLLGCYHLILHQIEGRHLLPSSSSTMYTGLVAAVQCGVEYHCFITQVEFIMWQ